MGSNNKQFDIRKALIASAQSYFVLLDKEITLYSNLFKAKRMYKLKFFETNFLHLTGLTTTLSSMEFFNKCLSGVIQDNEYCLGPKYDRRTIKRKLKHLVNIGQFFAQEIMVQESFVKNKIVCRVATSDGECTVGFVDGKYYLRPQTILANNHLNPSEPIYYVLPIINTITKKTI